LFDGLEAEPAYITLEVVVVKDAEVVVEAGQAGVPEKAGSKSLRQRPQGRIVTKSVRLASCFRSETEGRRSV